VASGSAAGGGTAAGAGDGAPVVQQADQTR
jgi:hypothetical protein